MKDCPRERGPVSGVCVADKLLRSVGVTAIAVILASGAWYAVRRLSARPANEQADPPGQWPAGPPAQRENRPAVRTGSPLRPAPATPAAYPWVENFGAEDVLANRIAAPAGFDRDPAGPDSFSSWLRHLPLKKGRPPVLLHNGRPKANQSAHAAVIDIDVGSRDLQQCADAVIRLRAEYLFSRARFGAIAFNFTSGDRAAWQRWAAGYRPRVRGNTVTWTAAAPPNSSYASFRTYLDTVFTYAGTSSLSRELTPVRDPNRLQIGDVFIQGGFPGHAVIVLDLATHRRSGRKVFLLAQSYMPAQDIHLLRNLNDAHLSPWYALDFGGRLRTPEWSFRPSDLKRFP